MKTAVEEIEGRLNAQRELLVSLLALLMRDMGPAQIEQLEQDILPQNGEEDPGAVPSQAFAIATATADEMRTILKSARMRAQAAG